MVRSRRCKLTLLILDCAGAKIVVDGLLDAVELVEVRERYGNAKERWS